jgi:hypothetical protein
MIATALRSDPLGDALLVRVNEAWDRYSQDRTPENHRLYKQDFRAFADWVLHGKLPGKFSTESTGLETTPPGRPHLVVQASPDMRGEDGRILVHNKKDAAL